jgi:outer membrane protein assembly factor BamB
MTMMRHLKLLFLAVFLLISFSIIPKGFADGPTTYQTWEINAVGDVTTLLPIQDISGDGVSEVVILSGDRVIYAIDGVTGKTIWNYTADSFYPWIAAVTSPSLDVNHDSKSEILVAAKNGLVLLLNGFTGEQLWNFTSKDISGYKYGDACFPEIHSVHLISDKNGGLPDAVIISGSGDQCPKTDIFAALALGTNSGQKIWEFRHDEDYHGLKDGTKGSSPDTIIDVNKDGTDDVLIADDQGILYVIDGSNGALRTTNKLTISGAIWNLVALPDITGDGVKDALGLEFIDGGGGPDYARIDALDVASNKILWQIKLGDGLYQSGALYSAISLSGTQSEADRIAVTQRIEDEQNLVLLDAKTGNQLWQVSLGNDIGGDDLKKYYAMGRIPDLNGNGYDELAIGKRDSTLYLLDLNDATTVWSYPLGGQATNINFLSTDGKQKYIIAGNNRSQVIALAGLTPIPTKLTIEASEQSVIPGSKLVVSGVVSPSFPGDFVQIQYIDPKGSLTTRALVIAVDGSYTDTIKPELLGTWQASAEFKAKGYYVDSKSQTISFTVKNETKNSVFDLQVEADDTTKVSYPISYLLDTGKITNMSIDKERRSLRISIDPSTAAATGGTLRVELPKSIIDTWEPRYRVIVDGRDDATFQELSSSDTQTRILSIPFSSGAHQIEIVGTAVVPEFSSVAAGILLLAMGGLIAVSKSANFRLKWPAKS